jgi:uncharacterized membrane protein YdbT with pleckstrin-like domain
VLPELELSGVEWRSAPLRAVRRVRKVFLAIALVASLGLALPLKWWDVPLLAVLIAWAFLAARLYVRSLGWAVIDGAVLFRSGWLWRHVIVAPFVKIQAVSMHESPFDRRTAMARVRVDTAGAGDLAHRVDIPYLPRQGAQELFDLLGARAAQTAFRW